MVQRRKRKVVQTGRGECVGGRIVSQGCTIGRKGDRTQDLPELSPVYCLLFSMCFSSRLCLSIFVCYFRTICVQSIVFSITVPSLAGSSAPINSFFPLSQC